MMIIWRIFHGICHLLGCITGRVETWWTKGGTLMVGFRCAGCGKLMGVHPVPNKTLSVRMGRAKNNK